MAVPVQEVRVSSVCLQVASALAARHIGGAVNYVAVGDALGMSNAAQVLLTAHMPQAPFKCSCCCHAAAAAHASSPDCVLQAAGLAADNLLCAVYFSTLFQLARKIPPDPPETGEQGVAAPPEAASALQGKPTIQVRLKQELGSGQVWHVRRAHSCEAHDSPTRSQQAQCSSSQHERSWADSMPAGDQPAPGLRVPACQLSMPHPAWRAQVLEGATALAVSMAMCWAGSTIAAKWGISGALIPIATGRLCRQAA